MSRESIGVKSVLKWVRIILVDARPGNVTKRVELLGRMTIPETVYLGKVYTNWAFEEFAKPVRGIATDLQPEGCTLVFPFIEPHDAFDAGGRSMSLGEIKRIFMKYHPQMKVVREV